MNLEDLIKFELGRLPERCHLNSYHEWVKAYGTEDPKYYGGSEALPRNPGFQTTHTFPYYICKHCHAVSNNYTTSTHIKRVR